MGVRPNRTQQGRADVPERVSVLMKYLFRKVQKQFAESAAGTAKHKVFGVHNAIGFPAKTIVFPFRYLSSEDGIDVFERYQCHKFLLQFGASTHILRERFILLPKYPV